MSGSAAFAGAEMPENLRFFVADPKGPDAYPIVTFSWILLYKKSPDQAKAVAVRDVFRWTLTEGQRYASELRYIPLPPAVARRALASLSALPGT